MTYYAPWLVTLDYVRLHRDLATTETGDDALLKQFIAESSAEFIEAIDRVPMPYDDTKSFSLDNVRGLDLKLRDDLLAVTSIANADGGTVSGASYNLRPDNLYPKHTVELTSAGGSYWAFNYREDRVSIPGVWGYVPHYAQNAYRSSGVNIPVAGMLIDATSLVLTSGQGASFETGQYIAVTTSGSQERMQITAKVTDTLTVSRGELGTTAAAHTSGDAIQIISPLADIQAAVREMVVYRYLHKDQIGSRVTVIANGVVTVEDLSPQVAKTIARHKRKLLPMAV